LLTTTAQSLAIPFLTLLIRETQPCLNKPGSVIAAQRFSVFNAFFEHGANTDFGGLPVNPKRAANLPFVFTTQSVLLCVLRALA